MKKRLKLKETPEVFYNTLMEEVKQIKTLTKENSQGDWEFKIETFFRLFTVLQPEARDNVLINKSYKYGNISWQDAYDLFLGVYGAPGNAWITQQFSEERVEF